MCQKGEVIIQHTKIHLVIAHSMYQRDYINAWKALVV